MLFDAKLTILIVSPQPWDGIPVSKHNYAHELASLGHRVVFVDPPVRDGSITGIDLRPSGTTGIEVLRYCTPFPYALKFHARPLFNHLMGRLAGRLSAAIGTRPDIIWDFDVDYRFADIRAFGAGLTVFHPVDDPVVPNPTDKHADLVLAVGQRFLDKIEPKRVPMHVIPHGLAGLYEALARKVQASPAPVPRHQRPLTVGMVGNLDRADIDWNAIRRMVEANPAVTFRFTGPFSPAAIAARRDGTDLTAIRNAQNAAFEGRKLPTDIISSASEVDVWLVAYDPEANANAATNSHKLLEYLATGSPVVCNRVEAYVGNDLVSMPPTTSNAQLPDVLAQTLLNLHRLDSEELRARRAAFALGHSYPTNIARISQLLDEVRSKRTQNCSSLISSATRLAHR